MIIEIIAWIIAFVSVITIHEAAHAWMSDKLGDPTARLMGRLSLNPLVHYDPVGTTMLLGLVILKAFGFPVIPFGWAKPVQFDSYNLKNPRKDSALISLAGPVSNLIFATLTAILLGILGPLFQVILEPIISLNVILAVFNLVPIHPLDGGKIFIGLLPKDEAYEADVFLSKFGPLILLFLVFPSFGGTSPIFRVLSPVINVILELLFRLASLI